jgi:prenyltransferase beta subunit
MSAHEWYHHHCLRALGGFGGHLYHDAHLLYTLSAIQILAIMNALDRLNVEKVVQCKPTCLMNRHSIITTTQWLFCGR